VLLLHGWGANLQTFDGLARPLAPTFRVVRLDLPGFGGTEQPPSDWHIADYAQFVSAFLQKLGVSQPACIIAHSFGGRVTIKGRGAGHNQTAGHRAHGLSRGETFRQTVAIKSTN
jgi:pimeloyl-ACP methyl ester carboxylesterase